MKKLTKRMSALKAGLGDIGLLAKPRALKDAIGFLKNLAGAPKFDESMEIAVVLGVDPKKSDQQVRGMASLPNGTGKKVSVAVFTGDEGAAGLAGADYSNKDEILEMIGKGNFAFDKLIVTRDQMTAFTKLGLSKSLGPRGLMPNPKTGTVVELSELTAGIKGLKTGQIEFKLNKGMKSAENRPLRTASLAAGIGKRSFTVEQIEQNVDAFLQALVKARPQTAKGHYLQKAYLSTTMGPSVAIDISSFNA